VRVWTWQYSGPAEPPLDDIEMDSDGRRVVWDCAGRVWHRDERGHWHACQDTGLVDLPWSTMLELTDTLRSEPAREVPLP
jgi:hypothetical protein